MGSDLVDEDGDCDDDYELSADDNENEGELYC